MTPQVILLDIEGTTSSTSYVREHLYPYGLSRFFDYLNERRDSDEVHQVLAEIREIIEEPSAELERCVWWLKHWVETDQKITPLKTIQGWIFPDGFARGELTSHFYPDVIPVLRQWHSLGYAMSIFSSGAAPTQKAWFGASPEGDLRPMIRNHFDTVNIGPKKEASSFRTIALKLNVEPHQILFLSDLVVELDCAREAGYQTIGVRRQGDEYFEQGVGDHKAVLSFEDIQLDGADL
ncbi:MAG: acireductone synthase [Granulosicoccus sp.]